MNGYETAEQRKQHIKGLIVELEGIQRSIPEVEKQLKAVPEEDLVERAQRERDLRALKQRAGEVEEQLRLFKGEAPAKRASKRAGGGQAETR
jgi:hypothetical protein